MPRPLRIEYEGALYHALSRGDRREAIFLDDRDKAEFLRTFGQACLKTGWQAHAYCLMTNHFDSTVPTVLDIRRRFKRGRAHLVDDYLPLATPGRSGIAGRYPGNGSPPLQPML